MEPDKQLVASQPRRKKTIGVIITLFVFAVVIAALPRFTSKTSLRDSVLQSLLGDDHLRVSSRSASFGWFSPLRIDHLAIQSADGDLAMTADELTMEKSWFQLWLSSPVIGKVQVIGPKVEIVIDEQLESEMSAVSSERIESWPTISTSLTNGTLVLREQGATETMFEARNINVSLHTQQTPTGSVLTVDPIKLADHETLTSDLCDHGLQYLAPVLSDEFSVEGKFSFELTKIKFTTDHKELSGEAKGSQMEGTVTLHQVTVGFKNDVTRRLAMLAAELMELSELPERIRLATDAELAFRFHGDQVDHQGMVLLLPEVAPGFSLRSSGSVELDESLGLQILFQIPKSLLNETQLASELSATPLELHVTGTIDQPKLDVPEEQEWVSLIQDRLSSPEQPPAEVDLANRIMNVLNDLLSYRVGETNISPTP